MRAPAPGAPADARAAEFGAVDSSAIASTVSTRPTAATGARGRKNANRGSAKLPIRMFCGLPVIVAALPILAAIATANRYGTGSRLEPTHDLDDERRHDQADRIVQQERREEARGKRHRNEQRERAAAGRHDPAG